MKKDYMARLEQAAIAGTGLLGEDFRLQRAAEQLKPLAGASPVFGKIDSRTGTAAVRPGGGPLRSLAGPAGPGGRGGLHPGADRSERGIWSLCLPGADSIRSCPTASSAPFSPPSPPPAAGGWSS